MREDAGDESLQRVHDLVLAGFRLSGELPPSLDALGRLAQRLRDLLVHLPPVDGERFTILSLFVVLTSH